MVTPTVVELHAERVCVVCGRRLVGRRPHALTCGDACRTEAKRLRAILAGDPGALWPSIAARLAARGDRAAALLR